jgi:glycosyltransferase involved in cell wall biosynthesis
LEHLQEVKKFRQLSVIIPVYNEESTIAEVIERVAAIGIPLEKEIIVVDDGSNDKTCEILQLKQSNLAYLYQTPVNIGKGAAVRIGLTLAKGDIILLQDADLELDPGEYQKLLQPILDGKTEVVYGSRFLKNNRIPFIRRRANQALTLITNLLYGSRLTDMETAYKVFTMNVAKRLHLKANRFEIEPELTARICQAGFKIVEVPVSYCPRTKSEGKKINWRDGVKAVVTLFQCRFEKSPAVIREASLTNQSKSQ